MTFSWGTLLGWSAVAGAVNWPVVIPMYIAKVAWGIAYDTIYAHQVSPFYSAYGAFTANIDRPGISAKSAG